MRVLMCHNFYCEPGGEDQVFSDEAALLESRGHEVLRYTMHNNTIAGMNRLRLAWRTLWNSQSYREVRGLIRRERPDVMHCTNTFPLISPSVYYAARAEGVPVVQSLHNFRLLCANGILRTEGPDSLPCPGGGSFRCLRQGCYRNSSLATFVVLSMLRYHRLRRTWTRMVDQYIALTRYGRDHFVAKGLPAEKVIVKPNFVGGDRGMGSGSGGYAVFVGRLSWEKGVKTLLDAWTQHDLPLKLKIVGDGPMAADVRAAAGDNVEWLGRRPFPEILDIMAEAEFLVFPSVWHETFGRTIIEAFSTGTPVIAAKMASAAELVADGRTGYHFKVGNPGDLAAKVRLASAGVNHLEMRRAARREYEEKYTPEANYAQLMEIYRRAGASLSDGNSPRSIGNKTGPKIANGKEPLPHPRETVLAANLAVQPAGEMP
jgi:glycosyltransferase involved in cell wall biosynthesis